ncbi:MAG: hypothetical protein QW304_05730 [Thermoproteota archaeon]
MRFPGIFGGLSEKHLHKHMGEAISKRERAIKIGKTVLKTMGKIIWEAGRISAEGLGLVETKPKRKKKRTRRKKKAKR